MVSGSSGSSPKICIIGRVEQFHFSIGHITYAVCEMLARAFDVCVLPTEPHLRGQGSVRLPNGRTIPVCRDLDAVEVSIYCDVLAQGRGDFNFALTPRHSMKFAYVVFDSDMLASHWVDILNAHFDVCLVPSPHLIATAARSAVRIPVSAIPIPLDLEGLLSSDRAESRSETVRLGSVASFHPRKGLETLVEAYLDEFSEDEAHLVLHSNLAIGPTYDRIIAMTAGSQASRVTLSHEFLSANEKNRLIQSFDVFCNLSRGESYSIGPREALAIGKTLVISAVGGHLDLIGVEGVFAVEPTIEVPARYVELENLIHGNQLAVSRVAARRALRAAVEFVRDDRANTSAMERRRHAQEFTFSRLGTDFATLINVSIGEFRRKAFSSEYTRISADTKEVIERRLGRHGERVSGRANLFVPLYDGGFFSLFNAFLSHLVWAQYEEGCQGVLPRWSVEELLDDADGQDIVSFCYGTPQDGNLWLKLFEPLFGYTAEEMALGSELWGRGEDVVDRHNGRLEPQMTYVNAYDLYRTESFARWRKQYYSVFVAHIRLIDPLRTEIDRFCTNELDGRYAIAVHCRHPSHTVEQPGNVIAQTDDYIAAVKAHLSDKGIDPAGDDWVVFLATDNERAVSRFAAAFGKRVKLFRDVRRTTEAEDGVFDARSSPGDHREGFQLQHIVARDRKRWSIRMAHEILRDAWCMARCHALIHVVSNVSTAVSYMNPDLEMIFCRPKTAADQGRAS